MDVSYCTAGGSSQGWGGDWDSVAPLSITKWVKVDEPLTRHMKTAVVLKTSCSASVLSVLLPDWSEGN